LKLIRGVIFFDEPEVEIITNINNRTNRQSKSYSHVIMSKRKHQMKMIHATFRSQRLKERERWKVHLWSQRHLLHQSKSRKSTLGHERNPKMASIGDYWDEKTLERITELLHEYNDLFPTTFTEMKGIAGELGEMKIPLKPEARPVRQRPYRLNPVYKKKVKEKLTECWKLAS
jgi:hypothetical protein